MAYSELCQCPDQLPADELRPIVTISSGKDAEVENGPLVDIFYNIAILIRVDPRCQNVAGMVVNQCTDIALYHAAVLSDRQLHIFNVALIPISE